MKTGQTGRQRTVILAGVAVVLLSVAAIAVWQLNPFGRQQPSVPLQAFFVAPAAHAAYPVGTPVPVRAVVRGEHALIRAELWADGIREVSQALDEATEELLSWRYTPRTEGVHELVVRVIDSGEDTVDSRVLELQATVPVIHSARVPAVAGESIADLARRFGATTEDVQAANPAVQPDQPLDATMVISIPFSLGDSAPAGAQEAVGETTEPETEAADEVITIPAGVSGAYLYATGDDRIWYRIPEDEGSLIVPQGTQLRVPGSVYPALDHDSPDISSTFEIWGWRGGTLQDLGTVAPAVNPTTLDVCNSTYDCYGDMGGSWVKETSIPEGEADQMRKLWWYNADPAVDQAILQISLFPFADTTTPSGVYESMVDSKGSFPVDFADIFSADDDDDFLPSAQIPYALNGGAGEGSDYAALSRFQASSLWKDNLATWYLRVIPLIDGQIAGDPSPQVMVHQIPSVPAEEVVIHVPPPIYDVEVLGFTPIHFPEPGVCHGAMILDTDYTITSMTGDKLTLYPAGTVLCPAPYKGVGEESWYEQLWDFVSSGVSWISEAYNTLKSSIVNAVGSLVCGGDDTCTAFLAAGLDMGLVALGIPPTLPNFDQLMNEGFDYLAATLAEQAGCPDVACKELIKQGLQETLAATKNTNPGCKDAAAAHSEGIEPLCLPEGVTAHPDPRALRSSATLTVQVTRNANPILDPVGYEMFKEKYILTAMVDATNAGPVGGTIINIPPYNESVTITEPLQGAVFKYVGAPIPVLDPGQSVTLPFSLVATEYWVPGHKEAMHGWTTVEYKDGWPQYYYDDWWKLYWGATVTIDARITACDINWTGACLISEDGYGPIQIPLTAN